MPIVGVKTSMASLNPKRLLDGETPRLIDEWQIAPKLWDAVRFEADHRDALGQFVLTGSAVPPDTREITHSQATDYYDAVVHSDINRADGARKDPERVKRLMRSLARNQGQQIANTAIAADVAANDEATVNQETVASYIAALKKIFVVEDMPAWNPNLRSKSAIRTSDTRYFVDASIAAAALGIGPSDLINGLNTMGFLFEAMCVRDLRVFAEALGGSVYHFRNKAGLECDAVVHLRNGSYGLIEIKLGGEKLIKEGVETLTALAGSIDTDKMKAPAFRMILTAAGRYAYRREDGICIVPIGCLRD